VNLSDLAQNAALEYLSQHPSNAEVLIQPGIEVCGDPSVLDLAIRNLLDNAFKYSSKTERPSIAFGASIVDGEDVYYVRDNGVGFDMQYAAKIFEPFLRLHRDAEYPGTGIGLANVQRVITRHSGKIWVDSALGKGTTVFFTLNAGHGADAAPLSFSVPSYLR
jgi:light-regulated signal transduction histidine kinase (bacteriophytochrome)